MLTKQSELFVQIELFTYSYMTTYLHYVMSSLGWLHFVLFWKQKGSICKFKWNAKTQNLKIAQNQDRIEFQGDELSCISNAILIQILVSS